MRKLLTAGLVSAFLLSLLLPIATTAATRPDDESLARTLTLRLSDFPSGWTARGRATTHIVKVGCPSAPKIEGAITGFNDSRSFVEVDDPYNSAVSNRVRVFASLDLAKRWFNWAGGGRLAACNAADVAAHWHRAGYRVTDVRHARQSFSASCSGCPQHKLSAWAIRMRLSRSGEAPRTVYNNLVIARYDRAVVTFVFASWNLPYCCSAASLVGDVLERGP